METEIKTDAADLSRKYFFIVSNSLIDHCAELKINSVQLHLILTIIRHAYQNDSAYPSIPTIQRKTGLSKSAIILNLKKLEEKGYITITRQFRDNNGKSNNLYSFKALNNILDRLIKGENIENIISDIATPCTRDRHPHVNENYIPMLMKTTSPCTRDRHPHVHEIDPNNTYKNKTNINNTYKNKTKDSADESAQIFHSSILDLLDYLNLRTNKNFSAKNKNNLENISARLKDGFTVEQLKSVIDKKTQEWLNDEDMNQYLNPQTLFRPKKFEIYLNTKSKILKSEDDDSKYKNIKTTHIDNVTGEIWVTGD